MNIVVGECEIEEKFLSYIEVVVGTEVPKAIFNVYNRKQIRENVHEIVNWQSVSMVGGMESQRTWKQISCEMIVEVEVVRSNFQ